MNLYQCGLAEMKIPLLPNPESNVGNNAWLFHAA